MRYYIIAGEASGDLHGSKLIKELKNFDSNAEFRFWGGDLMQKESGQKPIKHIKELAFMGFTEVLMNLKTILKNITFCKKDILEYKPDTVILIDYPGFNLRIAKFAKLSNLKVCYFISPQIWAWKQSRIKTIKKHIDRMCVILPFEKDFYLKFGYNVDYVGNPILDSIAEYKPIYNNKQEFIAENKLGEKPIIAILPGSRVQEITTKLPVMLKMTEVYKDFQFVIAGTTALDPELYMQILGNNKIPILYNKTYEILRYSYAAMVTSGTATLETALFKVPEVVCYRAGNISFHIAKRLVKIKYVSLVNLILGRLVVKELIQNDLTFENLKTEMDKLLYNKEYREEMFNNYNILQETIGLPGASKRTADVIWKFLNNK